MPATNSSMWNDLHPMAKVGVFVVGGVVVFIAVKEGYAGVKEWRRKSVLNNSTMTGTTGTGNAITVDLGSIAAQINEAFYNNDWFGASEDEEGAINALVSCPASLIKDLIPVYKAVSDGKDLKSDFIKFLSPEEYNRVKYLFV